MNILRKLFFKLSYIQKPPWDTNQTPPEVFEFIANKQPGRALDLGCGTGTNVITLAKHGWRATGVDYVPKAIHIARRKAKKRGVNAKFFIDDVTHLKKIAGQFDLILDIGCYHSLDNNGREAYQENIKDFLVPGGYFLIYLFFKTNMSTSSSGAIEADLIPFSNFLLRINRTDGTERGIKKSSWITYKKPPYEE